MPFPDRIYQADKHAEPFWQPNEVGGHLNEDYFGGDLKGIQMKLPYLHKMGVDFIYLNPIFEAHSNHRYNTADYLRADPLLGTNEDFEGAVYRGKEVRHRHHSGRRVQPHRLRQCVLQPGGPLRRGRCLPGRKLPPTAAGTILTPSTRAATAAGGALRPCPKSTRRPPPMSILSRARAASSTPGSAGAQPVSGWMWPTSCRMSSSRRCAPPSSGSAPKKFLLGEVWEDATTKFGFNQRRTYLLGKGLDSVMNYPFKNAVLDFVKGKPAEQAINEIMTICEHYPAPAMDTALNFLSTHDTERALTVIADEPANGRGREWQSGRCVTGDAYEEGILRLKMAYAIIYTLPGVPCLYYGDEIAMQGYRDPFNRAFFRWDAHEQRLRPVLAQLAQLRHTCEAFRTGALRVLRAEDGILHYQRIGQVETAEIIVNRTEHIIVETLASGKVPR